MSFVSEVVQYIEHPPAGLSDWTVGEVRTAINDLEAERGEWSFRDVYIRLLENRFQGLESLLNQIYAAETEGDRP